MKRNILFLLIAALAFAGCRSDDAPVTEPVDCINCGGVNMVEYSMPNGNDLKLETTQHVIKINALPGKVYDYYVWTGDKTYNDAPDIVIQDGNAAVLVEE